MALSQTGATYRNQSELQRRDRMLGEALDDLASQLQSARNQGNFGLAGPPAAPHPVTAIVVKSITGYGQIQLTHNNAPAGSEYVVEFSATPTFPDAGTIRIDNGQSLNLQQYFAGQKLYFRAASKFRTSGLSAWTYFGSQNSPTAVTF